MEALLNRSIEQKPRGWLASWYVAAHVARCGPCRRFLTAIRENRERLLKAVNQEPDEKTLSRLMRQAQIAGDSVKP